MKTLLKNCTVILNDDGNVRAESGLNIAVDGEFIGYIGSEIPGRHKFAFMPLFAATSSVTLG